MGGPPRRQHVRGAGLRRARGARAPGARRGPVVLAHARARLAQGGARGRRSSRRRGEARVLAVGEALPPLPGRRRAALPIDVARTISDLFERAALDLCHVHEPFAPSVASTALRHSRALNVGTFHAPTERVVATQVARKVVQLVFGRLDARTAAYGATARAAAPLLPGRLHDRHARRRRHAAPAVARRRTRARSPSSSEEERGALRVFLRALRRLDPALPWDAVVHSERGPSSSTPLRADLLRARALRRLTRRRRWRAPTSSSPPPTASRPRRG